MRGEELPQQITKTLVAFKTTTIYSLTFQGKGVQAQGVKGPQFKKGFIITKRLGVTPSLHLLALGVSQAPWFIATKHRSSFISV